MSTSDFVRGLYGKFIVRRTDGSDQPGGKHDQCRYFVLDLDHDKYALSALRAYARRCAKTHPMLSRDLLAIVDGNELMKARPASPEAPQEHSK
jgi:hypothetical protein